MAVQRVDMKTTLGILVATGQTSSGSPTYSTRSVSNIETTASDGDIYAFGVAYGGLQAHAVGKITRTDKSTLAENS